MIQICFKRYFNQAGGLYCVGEFGYVVNVRKEIVENVIVMFEEIVGL